MSLIIYAIPVFFILIGIELLITKMRNLSYYRLNDAITNLSCGIGSQISGIFLKTVTFIGYLWLYKHAPVKIDGAAFAGLFNPATEGARHALEITGTILIGLVLFTGVDFFYYWFHRLAHEISFLWGSHVVHHQSEEYNLTVALRQAALQGAFSWVFYLPLAIAGFQPGMFLTIASLQTLYQFWIHTKLIGKMHPAFEYVFNTPSHHRVHHGVNPKYIDRNHGGTLIIFDRMFNTFQAEEEEVVYGITKQPQSWNPLWVNFEYWIDLFRETFKVKGAGNAVRMMVKMPGWKPAELGGISAPKEVSTATFNKYNTEISPGLNYYILAQFVIVLLGTTLFLLAGGAEPFTSNIMLKVAVAGLIVLSLINFGGMFERKGWLPFLELFRMLALVSVLALLFKDSKWFLIVVITASVVAVLSLIWFSKFVAEFKLKFTEDAQVHAG